MKYVIRDREAGNVIEDASTIEEAKKIIQNYEQEDRSNNSFVENFYEIYNEETEEIEQ